MVMILRFLALPSISDLAPILVQKTKATPAQIKEYSTTQVYLKCKKEKKIVHEFTGLSEDAVCAETGLG